MIQQEQCLGSVFFSLFFFLFKASDPFFLFISCIREETEWGQVESQKNYGDRGHWEETAPGEDLEKEMMVIFQQNQ